MSSIAIVITAPRPISTINRTMHSIKYAGWQNIKTIEDKYGEGIVNTWLRAVELAIDCNVDYCLLAQDDVVFCKNTKKYFENTVPHFDICSLFSFFPCQNQKGWFVGSLCAGAQAYILKQDVCKAIVKDLHFLLEMSKIDYCFYDDGCKPYSWMEFRQLPPNESSSKKWKVISSNRHIDVHVDCWSQRNKKISLLHCPCLCGHLGINGNSALGNNYLPYDKFNKFAGAEVEEVDALSFCSQKIKKTLI